MTRASSDAAAGLVIRLERPPDFDAIHVLTDKAFVGRPFSFGTEAAIIRGLRASGDLTLSLVAEESGCIIGHVAFSPVSVESSESRWFGLGPISVTPKRQHQGIGRRLVRRGLGMLEADGAAGCALIGDPNIYGRFGFVSGALTYEGVQDSLVQYVVLNGAAAPEGKLVFASAFDDA